jgi:hypothetical protein
LAGSPRSAYPQRTHFLNTDATVRLSVSAITTHPCGARFQVVYDALKLIRIGDIVAEQDMQRHRIKPADPSAASVFDTAR